MAYTEILLPQTYVNDPGGTDFALDEWWLPFAPQWANLHPDVAVAAMRENSTSMPPPISPPIGTPPDGSRMYGRYLNYVSDHGNGRFEMTDPVLIGDIQSVAVCLLLLVTTGPTYWVCLWTLGSHFPVVPLYAGQSLFPPGVGWPIFSYVWPVNPATTLSWTLAQLQTLNAGFANSGGGGGYTSFDQLYVLVTYSKVMPVVETHAATGVTPIAATLNGRLVDDGGELCTLFFEWGHTPALGNVAAAGNGHSGDLFTANIIGLVPGWEYYYRAGATNSIGTSYGGVFTLSASLAPAVGSLASGTILELL